MKVSIQVQLGAGDDPPAFITGGLFEGRRILCIPVAECVGPCLEDKDSPIEVHYELELE